MSRRYRPYVTLSDTPRSTPPRSPHIDTPPPPPRSRPRTPLPSSIDADKMATQMITYMNVLTDHGAAIRAHPQSNGAYQRVVDQGRVLPPGTKWPLLDSQGQDDLRRQMEDIIQRPATSAVDHVEVCCAAHTLLLLQYDILRRLPFPECRKVEKKINELRAVRRRNLAQPEGRIFHGLAPPPPLPLLERLESPARCHTVSTDMSNSLLNFPSVPAIIGQQFRLTDPIMKMDIFYRVCSVEMSSDGCSFAVQYEGTRDTAVIGLDELKEMLQSSVLVSKDSPLT